MAGVNSPPLNRHIMGVKAWTIDIFSVVLYLKNNVNAQQEQQQQPTTIFRNSYDSGLACEYNGRYYANRSVFKPDHCTVCMCSNTNVYCEPILCPNIECEYGILVVPEHECCPVCESKEAKPAWRNSPEEIMGFPHEPGICPVEDFHDAPMYDFVKLFDFTKIAGSDFSGVNKLY